MSVYIAHINKETGEVQLAKDHSEGVAELCYSSSIEALKSICMSSGLYHDVGKWLKDFLARIKGKNIRVEHSICGAIAAYEKYHNTIGLMIAYPVAGHHCGIPDGGSEKYDSPDMSTLFGRMKRKQGDYSAYLDELDFPDINELKVLVFLAEDCDMDVKKLIDKFAFFVRYIYSILVDADSIDTMRFSGALPERALEADFEEGLLRVDRRLASFRHDTELQKARHGLQRQAFDKLGQDAEIYLMNMPTGSGKTLCSVKFALERAIRKQKKRIIYVIPYNNIIDQTAAIFEGLFGGCIEILRHQSTYLFDDMEGQDDGSRQAMECAAENWDAPFIITTEVQFFESMHSNKRSRLRKMKNIQDSVMIFDEAHLMPAKYLQPCLQGIVYATRYLNSEAVFLTATMPDFKRLISQYVFPGNRVVDLIDNTEPFKAFRKNKYHYIGSNTIEGLKRKAAPYPSRLIVVNGKKTAKKIFRSFGGEKYHLSTYMSAKHRAAVLGKIQERLRKLEEDYPGLENVPESRRITIVSTSLIEAGIDMDVRAAFRELTGLDSILQTGGRVDREGKWGGGDIFVFTLEAENVFNYDERANIVKRLFAEYEDISSPECISEYFNIVLFMHDDIIKNNTISSMCHDLKSIPFKTYSDKFAMIDQNTASIVIPDSQECKDIIENIEKDKLRGRRRLQAYTCSIKKYELEALTKRNIVKCTGTGILYLADFNYYDKNTGIITDVNN